MGNRHNRKQARHRPMRRRHQLQQQQQLQQQSFMQSECCMQPCAFMPQLPLPPTSTWSKPWDVRPSQRQSYSNAPFVSGHFYSTGIYRHQIAVDTNRSLRNFRQNDCSARDRHFFGGEEGEGPESEADAQLKGRMLDVVLGLFDGIDYED